MAYYGLSLNSSYLAGDAYLNLFLVGIIEIPAFALCLLLLNRVGRKKVHVTCMIIGGVAYICTIFTSLYLRKSKYYFLYTSFFKRCFKFLQYRLYRSVKKQRMI